VLQAFFITFLSQIDESFLSKMIHFFMDIKMLFHFQNVILYLKFSVYICEINYTTIDMEIKQKIDDMQIELVQKFSAYLLTEVELAAQGEGFIDPEYMNRVVAAKNEWESTYNLFLEYLTVHKERVREERYFDFN
jgi:hypothetical protein